MATVKTKVCGGICSIKDKVNQKTDLITDVLPLYIVYFSRRQLFSIYFLVFKATMVMKSFSSRTKFM